MLPARVRIVMWEDYVLRRGANHAHGICQSQSLGPEPWQVVPCLPYDRLCNVFVKPRLPPTSRLIVH